MRYIYPKDLSDMRFGRLIVLSYAGKSKNNRQLWNCRCDCGMRCQVLRDSLISGRTKSCGCLHREGVLQRCAKHNNSRSRLHNIWAMMKNRCYNINYCGYKNYGGRGIVVCDAWKNDYCSFEKWALEHGYDESFSIERINCNEGYSPENCTWIPILAQAKNTRRNHFVMFDNKVWLISELAKYLGVARKTIRLHISKGDWNIRTVDYETALKIKGGEL